MAKASDFNDQTTLEVMKKYGKVVRSGNTVFDESENLEVIPVTPALDLALGGGIKEGSWVILTGDPKSGKTTTALQFAATCQSKEYGERPIVYINAEGRLKSMNLGGIKGLEKEKIKIVESEDEPISAEDYLDIVEKYVRAEPNCVVIIDSVSSLIPSRELMDEVSGQFRAGLPKILSNFTKRLGNVVPRQKSIIIMITHFIANTTGYGKTKIADSGVKIRYQVDTHLEIKNTRPWEAGGKQIGQMVNWRVLCSSAGGFPGGEAQSWIKYGIGIDRTQEIINMALEFGLVSKAGAWYKCDFVLEEEKNLTTPSVSKLLSDNEVDSSNIESVTKFFKFQGQERLYNFLEENFFLMEILENDIRAML